MLLKVTLSEDEVVFSKDLDSFNSNLIVAIANDLERHVGENLLEHRFDVLCLHRYFVVFLCHVWIILKEFDALSVFMNRL